MTKSTKTEEATLAPVDSSVPATPAKKKRRAVANTAALAAAAALYTPPAPPKAAPVVTRQAPAWQRIKGYPYLVQRLRWEGKPTLSLFAGTDRGTSDPVKVGDYFSFDYMGSSEFEYGSIPAAKRILIAALAAEGWTDPVEVKSGEHTCWYVGPKAHLAMAQTFFNEELASDYTGMKERSNLREGYLTPGKYTPTGWWCVDSGDRATTLGFALFKTQDQAKVFRHILKG